MSDLHIDEFYADAVQAIVSLYRVFPRPVTLFAEDICGPDEPDEYGVHSHRFSACFATLLWLGEEGYLRFQDTIRQDAIDQAVLSGRCFTALLNDRAIGAVSQDDGINLQALPPSVQAHRATVIHQLEQALNAKSSTEIRKAFLPLLENMAK